MFLREGATWYNYERSKRDLAVSHLNLSKLTWLPENKLKGLLFRAQSLFHYIVRKLKHCVSLEAIDYFAPISVFQILVRIFKNINAQFHVSRSSFICKHFSYFVIKHIMEAKKLGFTVIQRILFSEQ